MFLRSKRVIHRDFKISNFLIGEQMEIKVSDFGLAVQLENSDEKAMIICGTPTYMAPEVIRGDVGYSF